MGSKIHLQKEGAEIRANGKTTVETDLKEEVKKYFKRHYNVDTLLGGSPMEGVDPKPIAKAKKSFQYFLVFLRILPWLCIGSFVFSIIWEFFLSGAAEPDMITKITRMTAVGGLVGYGTNYLAIKMLFKPMQRRPIWGQGLIPAQRDRIIGQLAKGMHEHILSEELIHKRIEDSGIIKKVENIVLEGSLNLLEDPEFQQDVKRIVHEYLSDYLNQKDIRAQFSGAIDTKLEENIQGGLKGYFFKTYKSWNKDEYHETLDNLILTLPQTAVEAITALEGRIGDLKEYLKTREGDMEKFIIVVITDILNRIDIRDLLYKQMEHFQEEKLEQMIKNATDEQLLYIQYLGTLLGIFGGLLNLNVWIALVYLGILGVLFLVDVAIFNFKNKKAIEASN